MHCDRRQFLKHSIGAALGGASLCGPLGNLSLISSAAAAGAPSFSDYRALICVFLYGGNDSFNTVVPMDTNGQASAAYAAYAAQRGALAIPQNQLIPLMTAQGGGASDGEAYGLHNAMPGVAQLFNAGKAAIVSNVGTLLYPTTKSDLGNLQKLPPQLYAHNDQQKYWQTSRPDDNSAPGWGGRIADLLYAGNPNQQVPFTFSVAEEAILQRGATISQYVTGANGVTQIGFAANPGDPALAVFDNLRAKGTQTHMLQRAYAGAVDHTIQTYNAMAGALAVAPTFSGFPSTYNGAKMQTIARLLATSGVLDVRRQVFYVSCGGYDTHDDQVNQQSALLSELSQCLKALYDATVQMGIADKVTIFTCSDFGRTLTVNGDGTDHGWGGHHFVLGGAVNGGRFYGTMPSLVAGSSDDAGWGQIIPTTAVDQYAASLANWFGVDAAGLATIFPNLSRFPGLLQNSGLPLVG